MEAVVIDEILTEVREALARDDWDRAVSLIEALRPADQADLFSDLEPQEQDELLPHLDVEDSADILEEMDEEEAAEVASRLEMDDLVRILDEMEPDEAADLLGDIRPEQAVRALEAMTDADEVRLLMAHEDESAGGLMTPAPVVLHRDMTVEEAITHLRRAAPDTETVYYLFVVDDDNRLVGVVSLRQLVIAEPETPIEVIMDPDVIYVQAGTDQEECARLMSRYDLLALPVTDAQGHLLGLITHDDLVEVLEEEATEDIYRLGGVPEEEDVDAPPWESLRTRLPWLVLNIATALISATVLSLFEGTIAQVAALAAFFPIVAGVSGSAGTQTLTVIVRSLALGEVEPRRGLRVLAKEVGIGIVNGIALGLLVALIAAIWKGMPALGLIVGIAMLLNLIAAGLAGVLVPLFLSLVGIDPALASPILVTTTTDTCGYFIYLGLATIALKGLL